MPHFSNQTARWSALQSRNPLAASSFIYAVTTTKIYCRPTCPSRLARKANIKFYDVAEQAEAAGFRACKRCRPELNEAEGDPQKVFADRACELLRNEEEDGKKWSVKGLAKEVGLTESHFCRVFKKVVGLTVGEYRNSIAKGVENHSGKVLGDASVAMDVIRQDVENLDHFDSLLDFGQTGDELNFPSNFDHGGFGFLEDDFLDINSEIMGSLVSGYGIEECPSFSFGFELPI